MARPVLPDGQKKERVPLYVKPENVQAVKDFAAALDKGENAASKATAKTTNKHGHHVRCTCLVCKPPKGTK